MTNPFQPAKRNVAYLNIALAGPSGSGKTEGGLKLATGMAEHLALELGRPARIAVADTENGSASLYSDRFKFDSLNLNPPYAPKKYVQAIEAAIANGYDILLIDSLSPAWAGEGGVQDMKDTLDARGGSQFANWKVPKGEYSKLKNSILHSQIHIIVTLRSKQAYAQVENNGKSSIKKMGMDPIAEPGLEYEFTTVLDLDMAHQYQSSKDRTGVFEGNIEKLTTKHGIKLIEWRNSTEPTPPAPKQEIPTQAPAPSAPKPQIAMAQKPQGPRPAAEQSMPEHLADPGNVIISGGKYDGDTIRDVVDAIGWVDFQRYVQFLETKASPAGWISHLLEALPAFKKQIDSNHAVETLTNIAFNPDEQIDESPKAVSK